MAAKAAAQGAELVLVPELQLTGYPPEDLVLKPNSSARRWSRPNGWSTRPSTAALRCCSAASMPRAASIIIASSCRGRADRWTPAEGELPNYGTFDEKRVFAHGSLPEPILFKGVKLGVPICEDIWAGTGLLPSCQAGRGNPAVAQRQPL